MLTAFPFCFRFCSWRLLGPVPKLGKLGDEVRHWVIAGKVCLPVSTLALRAGGNPRKMYSLSLLQQAGLADGRRAVCASKC